MLVFKPFYCSRKRFEVPGPIQFNGILDPVKLGKVFRGPFKFRMGTKGPRNSWVCRVFFNGIYSRARRVF